MNDIEVLQINSPVSLGNTDEQFHGKIIGILLEGLPTHASYKVEYYDGKTRKIEWMYDYQFHVINRVYNKIGFLNKGE